MSTPAGPFDYILSEQHLARALGVPVALFEYVGNLAEMGKAYEYRRKSIHGKIRELGVPVDSVMSLQRRITDFLWPLSLELHPACHGYTPGRSATTNAAPHCGARWVQRLDIKDFFPRTTPNIVTKALVERGAHQTVAELLTKLTTDRGSLPLGAPCSPLLSNLILTPVDNRVADQAASIGVSYTRYADDLTFSADAEFDMTGVVQSALQPLGYTLNLEKSRLRRRGQSIAVTGLRVAEMDHPRLPKRFKRELRQEFYFIEKFGFADHCNTRYFWHWIDEEDDEKQLDHSTRHLQGKVRYALGVEPDWMRALLDAHPVAASELTPPKRHQADQRLAALTALAAEIVGRRHVSLSREPTRLG
ncbi:MAG: RNA-directed DNA polymerase [Propionibacteriaceae bacterium]|nr:RNA-directed DNA polymerase [Propionibacteriaceae bacterium]